MIYLSNIERTDCVFVPGDKIICLSNVPETNKTASALN